MSIFLTYRFAIALLAFLAHFLPAFEYAAGQWTQVSSPTSVNLRNCVFTDRLHGWAVGDNGVIVHTSDGGITFTIQSNPVDYYINDLSFLNERTGWIVANETVPGGSTLIRTTNGGINWIAEDFYDSTQIFRTVYFRDSLNGYLAGFGGSIFMTKNGGMNWMQSHVDTSQFSGFPINRVAFANASTGFAIGGYIDVAGVIWRTTNGGDNWSAGDYSPEPFYDLIFRGQNDAFCAGGDFEYGVMLCRSSNSGLNWTYENLAIFGQAYSVDARTPSEYWMPLGYAESFALSVDSGRTWTSVPTPDFTRIYAIDFVDSLTGWAFGAGGAILKYTGIPTSAESNETNYPVESSLVTCYPNPFNPVTRILVELSKTSRLTIKVFDVNGRITKTLADGKSEMPGRHRFEFDGSGLATGVYFYEVTVSGEASAKHSGRILLLK